MGIVNVMNAIERRVFSTFELTPELAGKQKLLVVNLLTAGSSQINLNTQTFLFSNFLRP
jgi:hypothetical protein